VGDGDVPRVPLPSPVATETTAATAKPAQGAAVATSLVLPEMVEVATVKSSTSKYNITVMPEATCDGCQ
jgi:hypothetical protein